MPIGVEYSEKTRKKQSLKEKILFCSFGQNLRKKSYIIIIGIFILLYFVGRI